jgi:flagellar basal-body rod protein FlgC
MITSLSSTLSALRAFGKKMAVTANNVANVNSDEFKRSEAHLKEGEQGAVELEIRQIDSEGPIMPANSDGMKDRELSNVDLTTEIPNAFINQRAFEANLKMVETEDEMIGSILDIVG